MLVVGLLMGALGSSWAGGLDEAEALTAAGRPREAMERVRHHLANAPLDVGAHELLIDLGVAMGEAEAFAQTYWARAAAQATSPDAWYLAGRAALSVEASTDAFNRALELDPKHARARMGRGSVARATGQTVTAAEFFQGAIEIDPSLSEAWTGLRGTLLDQRSRALAVEAAVAATEALPGEREHWLAAIALAPGRATELAVGALRHHPDDPELLLALARASFEGRDWEAAAVSYERAMRHGAANPSVRTEAALVSEIRAGTLSAEGARDLLQVRDQLVTEPAKALETTTRLVTEWPRSGWARLVHGNLLGGAGQAEAAELQLRAAIDRMPTEPAAWSALGLLLLTQRRAAEAAPLLSRAAAARPDDTTLQVAAAVAVAEAGDPAAALERLEATEARFPTSTGPPVARARILTAAGQPDAAWLVLMAAMERQPQAELAVALAGVAAEAGHLDEAAEILSALADATGDAHYGRLAEGLRAKAAESVAP